MSETVQSIIDFLNTRVSSTPLTESQLGTLTAAANQRGQLRYLLYGKGILRCWPFQPACQNKQRYTKNFRQIVGMW